MRSCDTRKRGAMTTARMLDMKGQDCFLYSESHQKISTLHREYRILTDDAAKGSAHTKISVDRKCDPPKGAHESGEADVRPP